MIKGRKINFFLGGLTLAVLLLGMYIYYTYFHSGISKSFENNLIKLIKNDVNFQFDIHMGKTQILSKDFLKEIENNDKTLNIIGDGFKYNIYTADLKGKDKRDLYVSVKKVKDSSPISAVLSKNSEEKYDVEAFIIGKESNEIGYKVNVSLELGSSYSNKQVNAYRYDDQNEQYFFISKLLASEEGTVAFNIYRYGKYFIASEDAPRYDEKHVKLIYEEEFDEDGRPNKDRWKYDIGGSGWGNEEKQCYTDELTNAAVQDGKLIITARKEEYAFNDYTSARLLSKDAWLYGRIEVKAKLPKGVGTWPAIWMMPKENTYGNWPASGEIDIMEHVGFDHGNIHATIHTQKYYWKAGTQKSGQIKVDNVDGEFHVYSVEWTPYKMDFFVDGKKYFTAEYDLINDKDDGWKAWPFDKPFYLIMNIAVGGSWGGQQGIDDSIFPQSMEVDYVRVYDLGIEKHSIE
ncbi:glycoside hydrolase family 16 protein [Clostridium thermarum]|uniref:glycoside hydrolase family 16 protein n=1 Tax=Clostridium thermarum TaxID=1716543 RepID=UPI00111ED842|nr:glycoside hydrolase family 16 protein [Clostridium thermarum]